MILTPRDWQAFAQYQAIGLLGTHEGAEKLVEAKRYGALADVLEQQHRDIERLNAAVAAEREACRVACRSVASPDGDEYACGYNHGALDCEGAILARSNV